MKAVRQSFLATMLLLAWFAPACLLRAAETTPAPRPAPSSFSAATNAPAAPVSISVSVGVTNFNTASIPALRDPRVIPRQEIFARRSRQQKPEIIFLGDSLTDFWSGHRGRAVWESRFAPLHAANFGIGHDRTEHLLWRLQHDLLRDAHPKVIVLLIGGQNLPFNTPPEIAEGIGVIVKELRARLPDAKILLLGLFPRAEKPDAPERAAIKEVNRLLARLDNARNIRFLDIGPRFLNADGTLSQTIMPDFIHPSAKGYQIWADAILPMLGEMLK